MQVASVERIHLDKAIQLFDLINVANYNNFIVKGKKADYVSHNCGIMDEINFSAGPANAKLAANAMMKTYRAVKSRMKSRFISSGRPLPTILWMISSKKSENDFLEQYAKEVKDDPSTYIVDEPIWNVKPKGTYSTKTFKVAVGNKFLASKMIGDNEDVDSYIKQGYKIVDVPVDFKADFKKDVDGALMDIAGISASSSLKYLSVETMMETMLPDKNPFTTEILNIGTKDKLRIQDFFLPNLIKEKQFSKPIYIHIDMSQSGDKTGIAAIAIEGAKRIDENDPDAQPELYYKMLFGVDIKNPTDAQVDFAKTRQFIYYLKGLGWNIKCVSTDGFQSTDTQQRIAEHGINAKVLSLDRTPIGYEVLKSAINDKRVGLLNIEQLKKEAAEIQRDMKTGKIDHPENGCFTGDTKVSLVDGRDLTFTELVKEYEEGKVNYVYSFNHTTKRVEPKLIKKAWMTIKDANLVEVKLDNDEVIRCTPNHKFMLRDGSYVEAKDLQSGQSLMPLYRKVSHKGLTGYRLYYEPIEEVWHYEHRQFVSKPNDRIKKDEVVHHINFNKLDNTPNNLRVMSRQSHTLLHNRNQSDEERLKRSLSVKKWHEEHRNTIEYEIRADKTRQSIFANLGSEAANKRADKQKRILAIEEIFNVEWDKLSHSEKNRLGNKYSRMIDPTIQQRISSTLSKRHKEGLFDKAIVALKKHNESVKGKPRSAEDKEKMRAAHKRIKEYKNHKVVSVRYLDYTADVYDIEVEDNHNFALSSGIFVHNSKDLLDAVAGALWSASMDKDSYVYQHGEDLITSLEINMTPSDNKMQVMKDLHDMLAQDAQKAKEDAAKIVKRAEEKKLVNLTNMTEEQKQAYTNQTMLDADDDDDVYTPTRLDDSIILF